MKTNFAVVYDACVLYPAPVRDLLMHLAISDLFRAKWTDMIHDEWIEAVLRNRPELSRENLEKTRTLMNAHVRDCLVENHLGLADDIDLPDPNDRHVVSAAIKSGAELIITYNLKDFPSKILERFNIQAQHPDEFIFNQIDLNPAKVCEAVRCQRANLLNPPYTQDQLLDTFLQCGLPETATLLRQWRHAF